MSSRYPQRWYKCALCHEATQRCYICGNEKQEGKNQQ
jgi:hypothetical protein